jgi:hypothetical protein
MLRDEIPLGAVERASTPDAFRASSCTCVLVAREDVAVTAARIAQNLSGTGGADGGSPLDRDRLASIHDDVLGEELQRLTREYAATRFARYRTEAMLERAERRRRGLEERRHAIEAADLADAQRTAEQELREEARELLARFELLPPQPDETALALAREWDALEHARANPSPSPDFPWLEMRVAEARAAFARITSGVDPAVAEQVYAAHEKRVRAEHDVEHARRRERFEAEMELFSARSDEAKALARAGFESYAAFLMAVAEGVPGDPQARADAEAALASAEAELEQARTRAATATSPAELAARMLELRAEAAAVLGRFPGDDVSGELRALLVPGPLARELAGEMAGLLERAGFGMPAADAGRAQPSADAGAPGATGDEPAPVAAARRWIATAPSEPVSALAAADRALEREAIADELAALEVELAALEATREAQLEELDRLSHEVDAFEARRRASLRAATEADMRATIRALVTRHRRAGPLGGSRPLVLAGALDPLSWEAGVAAFDELMVAQCRAVVVSASPTVAEAAAVRGIRAVSDPAAAEPPLAAPRGA